VRHVQRKKYKSGTFIPDPELYRRKEITVLLNVGGKWNDDAHIKNYWVNPVQILMQCIMDKKYISATNFGWPSPGLGAWQGLKFSKPEPWAR
jgi:hypothetical protein